MCLCVPVCLCYVLCRVQPPAFDHFTAHRLQVELLRPAPHRHPRSFLGISASSSHHNPHAFWVVCVYNIQLTSVHRDLFKQPKKRGVDDTTTTETHRRRVVLCAEQLQPKLPVRRGTLSTHTPTHTAESVGVTTQTNKQTNQQTTNTSYILYYCVQ